MLAVTRSLVSEYSRLVSLLRATSVLLLTIAGCGCGKILVDMVLMEPAPYSTDILSLLCMCEKPGVDMELMEPAP